MDRRTRWLRIRLLHDVNKCYKVAQGGTGCYDLWTVSRIPLVTSKLPKTAQAILAMPGIQSLEKEPDGWCCHLHYGWTTNALSGGGTIIDTSLAIIKDHVKNAYQI